VTDIVSLPASVQPSFGEASWHIRACCATLDPIDQDSGGYGRQNDLNVVISRATIPARS
jgi:hypothetical protein